MDITKLTEQYLDGARSPVEMALVYLNTYGLAKKNHWRIRLAKWLLKPLSKRGW